jgi:hypothetical protein
VNQREEGVVLEVADHDPIDAPVEVRDDVAEQVVCHGSRGRHVLDLQGDRIGFEDANPDWENALSVLVLQDHDRRVRDRVDHQSLDRHLDKHGVLTLLQDVSCRRRLHREDCADLPAGF